MALGIRRHISLSDLTTLRMGGEAACELTVRGETDFDELSDFLMRETVRPFVIGKGSNLLAAGDVSDLALVRIESPASPEQVGRDGEAVIFRAGAGLRLPALLGWAFKSGLTGMEGLSGIPGTVGGAVAMNAGSYGIDMAQVVRRVRVWTPTEGVEWIDSADCSWGYRSFCPGRISRFMIHEVEFGLTESTPEKVKAAMNATMDKKKAGQPIAAWTAGCVFKNPEGHSAGRLLDQAGFKGREHGGCRFSPMHANFLENTGEGTAREAVELIEAAREEVAKRFEVKLETEVIII